jgi:predicted MFS family arabinose efflux permease
MTGPDTQRPRTTDRVIISRIATLLLAAMIGLVPFTVYSTHLVPIADAAGTTEAAIGSLRGLGGLTALFVGIGIAPLIDRWTRHRSGPIALGLLAAACLLGAVGHPAALAAFCLMVGAATALLTPVLLAAAAERFDEPADSGRAATMITSLQTVTAIAAAPVIGLLSAWRGWQGTLIITAAIAVLLSLLWGVRGREVRPSHTAPHQEPRTALQLLRRRPAAAALIMIALLRTAAFMGYLAVAAATFHDHFGLSAAQFTGVWTLSGISFFICNFLVGRLLASRPGNSGPLLLGALVAALVAVAMIFFASDLVTALIAVALMALAHSAVAAVITTRLVMTNVDRRGAVLSLNAAGMSFGTFLGAAIASAGLAIAGATGIVVGLGALTVLAVVIAVVGHNQWALEPS